MLPTRENPPADVRSRKPLRAAKVEVMDVEGEPGWYRGCAKRETSF